MKRGNRMRRAGLGLALLVLAAMVTGVAASATTTVMPKQMTHRWYRGDGEHMVVGRWGNVKISKAMINKAGWFHTKFSHVTAHRLSISGPRACSRTGSGTYRWGISYKHDALGSGYGYTFVLKKIHDACKLRVSLMIETDDAYIRRLCCRAQPPNSSATVLRGHSRALGQALAPYPSRSNRQRVRVRTRRRVGERATSPQ